MMWMLLVVGSVWGVVGSENSPPGVQTQTLQNLHCPPCERIHCAPRRALKLQCNGGITTGICGCCPACARTVGESCGGSWDYLGKCDTGLVCVYQDPAEDKPDAERKGICKAVLDSLDVESCRPECTREYCLTNPSEICSARSASLEKQGCQGPCQHTSCSSCMVLRCPSCPHTCPPSDPSCLYRFGRCIHSHMLAPHDPVCHQNLQSNIDGNFVCFVPTCPKAVN